MNHLLTYFRYASCALFLMYTNILSATDFMEPRGDLTLADALSAALQRNPALRSASFAVNAADAHIAQAGMRLNPEIGATFENFGGSDELRGTTSLESTLSLSQTIELGGKRSRRIDVARYESNGANLERDAKQLDVLAEVTRRFIDVSAQQHQVLASRRATELARQTLQAIADRVGAARAPEAERSRAAIALARTRLDQQQTEQMLSSARRRLAALWGSTEPRFGDVRADLFALPTVVDFDALILKLKTTPNFLRFTNTERLRDAEWQLAKAEAQSNVTIGGGLRRFEATGATGLIMNISMPLPLANRNQGAIREAAWRREQVASDAEAALIDTQTTLFEFYQNLQHARATTQTLREQIIPLAETALTQTQYGYQRGRFSYLELAAAQRELLDLQRSVIEAAATYHRVLTEIERLTNERLTNERLTNEQFTNERLTNDSFTNQPLTQLKD